MVIKLYDENFEIYGKPITVFSSLTYTDRWSADGDFKLIMPVTAYNDVKGAKYIYVDGRTFEISAINTSDKNANNELTLAGHNLNVLLSRVVVTTPVRIQGNLETEIRALVNTYCANGFQAIDKFAFETAVGYARAIDANAVRQPLSEFLYTELNKRGFSFELNYEPSTDQIVFSLIQSVDRTQDQTENTFATFSADMQNIENMEYERNETDYYNCAVVCDEDPTNPQTAIVDLSNGEAKRTIYIAASNVYEDTENPPLYVMVGTYSTSIGYIATSTDGQSWTNRVIAGIERLWSIDYQNGKFIAGGSNGIIATSVDGINWITGSTGSSYSIEGVSYNDGMYTAFDNNGDIYCSYDAITWSNTFYFAGKIVNSINTSNKIIAFSAGTNGAGEMISSDGWNWKRTIIPFGGSGYFIYPNKTSFINGRIVSTGYWYDGSIRKPISITSIDNGETYETTILNDLSGYRFLDMAAGLGVFVAVGQPNTIQWSTDGITWTDCTPSGGTPDYISVTFDGTLFHAYSATTKHHAYSADGKNWTLTTFTTSASLIDAVIYGAAQRQYSLYSIGYNALQLYKPIEVIDGDILPTAHPIIGTECKVGDVVDIIDTSREIIVSKILTEAATVYDSGSNAIINPKFGQDYLTLKKFIEKEIKRLV